MPDLETLRDIVTIVDGIPGQERQYRGFILRVGDVKRPVLCPHQRRQLGKQQLSNGKQVALALHHSCELRNICLQPVLLVVFARGCRQVDNHLVDVVLKGGDFALCLHGDGAGQVALRHGGSHFRDGTHLVGKIRGELVHVVRQIAPDAGGSGDARLAAELALDSDLASHGSYLIREGRQSVDHSVDGIGQLRDLALGFQHQLSF